MKLNDYVLRSDIVNLSKEQYQAFTCYLRFIGVDNFIIYDYIFTNFKRDDILIVGLKSNGRVSLLWSDLAIDPDAANPIPYEEILNMVAIGELMTYENR